MLTFRQQILSFFGELNRDVDVMSTIYASLELNGGKTLKMLTFRQHLRFDPLFWLEMLTFGQNSKPEMSQPIQKVDVSSTFFAKFNGCGALAAKMLTFRSLF